MVERKRRQRKKTPELRKTKAANGKTSKNRSGKTGKTRATTTPEGNPHKPRSLKLKGVTEAAKCLVGQPEETERGRGKDGGIGAWCRLGASKNRKQNAGKGNNMATVRQGDRASHVPRALHMLHMSPELPFALHCKKWDVPI